MRIFTLGLLISCAAWAQPRLAVHPLETRNLRADEAAGARAQFEVMLARLEGIRLAGTVAVEEAMEKGAASDCDVRDACLRFLAEATDAQYGMYAVVELKDGRAFARGRVVTVAGVQVRDVSTPLADNARDALVQLVRALNLEALPIDPPADVAGFAPFPAPPMVVTAPEAPRPGPRKLVGWGLVGLGTTAAGIGALFAGMSVAGTSANPPDEAGVVAPDRAERVAAALRQRDIASVLIPAGAAATAIGAIVLLWPVHEGPSHVALGVSPAGIAVSGVWP